MITPNLSLAQIVYDEAVKLARRWVAALPRSAGLSYNAQSIDKVQLHWGDKPSIVFTARPDVSGIHSRYSIPMSYLTDSSTLEADSVAAYEAERAAASARFHRIDELRRLPEVTEYLKLTNTYPYNSNQIWL